MKYFSMFSGIGGFELGLQNSKYDFECVGYCEIDKYARSIYERRFPNHINFGDATKIKTEELPNFELLVGGFPCQAFSNVGKRRGFDDTRGTLFFEIARVLKDKRPKYFLLENVKGLLSHNKGKTFQTILEVLTDLGYIVQWSVLNSKDFGVPQNRERIFIEGYFRERGGGEILSVRRVCEKDSKVGMGKHIGKEKNKLYTEDEIKTCLTAEGQHSGGKSFIKCINPSKSQAQKVFEIDGIATCLSANGGGQGGKTGLYAIPTDEDNREIKIEGNISPSGHHNGNVYSKEGIARTLCARDWKDPMKVIEKENDKDE